jgi:hypothetical protein
MLRSTDILWGAFATSPTHGRTWHSPSVTLVGSCSDRPTNDGVSTGCEENHPLCCRDSRPRPLLIEVPWGGTPCRVQRQ